MILDENKNCSRFAFPFYYPQFIPAITRLLIVPQQIGKFQYVDETFAAVAYEQSWVHRISE